MSLKTPRAATSASSVLAPATMQFRPYPNGSEIDLTRYPFAPGEKGINKTTTGGIQTLNRPVICQISAGNHVFFPEHRRLKTPLWDRFRQSSRLSDRFTDAGDG